MDINTKKILEYLEPKGVGIYDNISQPLSEIFGVHAPSNESAKHEGRQVSGFLDSLVASELIMMRDRPDKELGKNASIGATKWFNSTPIAAAITQKGIDELILGRAKLTPFEINSSIVITNDSIKNLNEISGKFIPFQKQWIMITAAIAGLALITSVLTFIIEINKSDELQLKEPLQVQEHLQNISNKIDTLNKTISGLQNTRKTLENDSTHSKPGEAAK